MCHCCGSSSPGLFPRKRESRFIPAQAGTQETWIFTPFWIPAFAGMTRFGRLRSAGAGLSHGRERQASGPDKQVPPTRRQTLGMPTKGGVRWSRPIALMLEAGEGIFKERRQHNGHQWRIGNDLRQYWSGSASVYDG